MADTAAFTDLVLPHLVNELNDSGDVVLILDDFHRLSGPALDSMASFIEHAPADLQLVLSTRAEPVLSLASLRAHGELIELRVSDLRFTPGETDEFLNGCLGLGLSARTSRPWSTGPRDGLPGFIWRPYRCAASTRTGMSS